MTVRRRNVPIGALVAGGLVMALLLAFLVSPHASSKPDGLEKVAADQSLDSGEKTHSLGDGPLAGYSVKGVDDTPTSTSLAGIIGVIVTFATGLGLFLVLGAVRRHRTQTVLPRRGVPAPSGP
jgi:cobalt/nickel transport system permease protein